MSTNANYYQHYSLHLCPCWFSYSWASSADRTVLKAIRINVVSSYLAFQPFLISHAQWLCAKSITVTIIQSSLWTFVFIFWSLSKFFFASLILFTVEFVLVWNLYWLLKKTAVWFSAFVSSGAHEHICLMKHTS